MGVLTTTTPSGRMIDVPPDDVVAHQQHTRTALCLSELLRQPAQMPLELEGLTRGIGRTIDTTRALPEAVHLSEGALDHDGR